MCGLVGFFSDNSDFSKFEIIDQMLKTIEHRGPDDSGCWVDQDIGLALGHRRLSIQDLSPAGNQPMVSCCGRYILVFNGEIYNHLKLRKELDKQSYSISWRGHSDSETLLACFAAWGIEATLKAVVGMFAIGLWDRQLQVLTLIRDRMGEKPLYWGWQGKSLYFGSELKAFKAHPSFNADIDRDSITLLLRHNCIPAPYSIYHGIAKLRPGHYIQIPLGQAGKAIAAQPLPYWTLNELIEAPAPDRNYAPTEAVDNLESALMRSIAGQSLSDVPIGSFLSGGIDSSVVTALMQAQSSRPINTFTIGFNDKGYNEATHAKAVAKHLGTAHTELYVSPENALAVIPKLASMYCEPFSDSSQIPTYLVSQLAKQGVTVALSGDGGDELFGGYNRYLAARQVWNKTRRLPLPIRQLATAGLRAISPQQWDGIFNLAKPILPSKFQLRTPGDKAHKLADVLSIANKQAFFHRLTSHWQAPSSLVKGATEPGTLISEPKNWPKTDSFEHAMMAMDAQTYLTDDILVKVDRAAMANSLETRVPMLDHRIVELAWRLPLNYKIRQGEGKWILKQVLYRHVPKSLIDRPKMGFGIPLGAWLRGPLREWAEALLNEHRLISEGYFHPFPIRTMWAEHLSGKKNNQHHLWDILMFQAWLEEERR